MKIIIVVDVQNDFINGALGTPEAQVAFSNIIKRVNDAYVAGDFLIYTQDTHNSDYLNTLEGKKLPVKHCIKDTWGWRVHDEVDIDFYLHIKKPTFGSYELVNKLLDLNKKYINTEIELFGFCTDICVLSNAIMIKNAFPTIEVSVVADCCAGVSPELHEAALAVMKSCQIDIK